MAKLKKTAAEHADKTARDQAKKEAHKLAKKLATWIRPEQPTLLADDATSQKLEVLLKANGERLAIMAPEGDVFDMMAGKFTKDDMMDLGIYLRAHPGEPVSCQRMGRTVELDAPLITMALTVQPVIIAGLASKPAFRGRGLLGRFLYAMPISQLGNREVRATPASEVVTLAYCHVIKSLARIDANVDGWPHRIKLTADAETVFYAFNQAIEKDLREGPLASMKEWGSKLAGATARLALVLHCVGCVGEADWDHDIDVATIEAAQRIARWAIPHAAAALDLLEASDDEVRDDAEFLLRWIKTDRPKESTFDRRDAQRHGQRRFNRDPQRLDAALELLDSTWHIAKLNTPKTGGRVTYAVSPYVLVDEPKRETPKSDENGDNHAPNSSLSPLSPGSSESKNRRVKVTI